MKLLKYISDLVFPPKCVFCSKVLKDGAICSDCERTLPYTKGDAVSQKFAFIDACISPLYYEDKVRESILRYKFAGHQAYSTEYGNIMSAFIDNNLDCGSIDVISWVPLSKKRLKSRGYNQSELMARELAKSLGLESRPVLKKLKNNRPQSSTASASERAKNVSGIYAVSDGLYVRDRSILLIDDVVTTGSTLSECARMLKKSGARHVYCATLARHRD